MNPNTLTTPIIRTGIFSNAERGIITVGLLTAVVLGLAGGPVGPGALQTVLFALSSLGWVAATMLLALRHARLGGSHTLVAAGMAILTVAEMMLWAGGNPSATGTGQTSAGGAMFYAPALLLVSVPTAYPWLVRIMGILASLPWAAFTFQFLAGQMPSYQGGLALMGYALISVTMIAWVVVLGRTEPQGG